MALINKKSSQKTFDKKCFINISVALLIRSKYFRSVILLTFFTFICLLFVFLWTTTSRGAGYYSIIIHEINSKIRSMHNRNSLKILKNDINSAEESKLSDQKNSIPKYKYCYQENNSTIIFIHLTNDTDRWLPLETCVFKSAAVLNPDIGVCILTRYPMRLHPKLQALKNLEIVQLDFRVLFSQTTLADWYEKNMARKQTMTRKTLTWQLSDAVRYAYVYKFGGKYLDTDTLILRNLSPLNNINMIGRYSKTQLGTGVLFFEKRHPLFEEVLKKFHKYFNPGQWGSVGPRIVTDIHFGGKIDNSTYMIAEPNVFYPTHYDEYLYPFKHSLKKRLIEKTRNSYSIHLWRFKLQKYWTVNAVLPNGSFIAEFVEKMC